MAIAFDGKTDSTSTTGTSWTFGHATAGSDRFLVVSVYLIDAATDNVTGVTYGGVSMTRTGKDTSNATALYMYHLKNPTTGSNNVVISVTGGSQSIAGASVSYTGVQGDFDIATTKNQTLLAAPPPNNDDNTQSSLSK